MKVSFRRAPLCFSLTSLVFLVGSVATADGAKGDAARTNAAREDRASARDARDAGGDAGAGRRGVVPPPPITVLAVFEWSREESVGARPAKTELFIYSSGMTVLVLSGRSGPRPGVLRDEAGGGALKERVIRKVLPRETVVGLLKLLDDERFRSFPERVSAKRRDAEARVTIRATLRLVDRTVTVTIEPAGDDRAVRAAPRGFAAIEKRVRAIVASLTPKADELDESIR